MFGGAAAAGAAYWWWAFALARSRQSRSADGAGPEPVAPPVEAVGVLDAPPNRSASRD
jgi:hypothetical protein